VTLPVGYQEFEFDLPGALLGHLVKALDGMQAGQLNDAGLIGVQEAQGVYQLFLDGSLVYIGKTDAEAGLLRRLERHSKKVLHRRNLDPARVTFKAVRIYVFTAMDLETELRKHYSAGAGLPWDKSGFGSNDPGRMRDTSKPGQFDTTYPLDIDRPLSGTYVGTFRAADILSKLKSELPYTLRFEAIAPKSKTAHSDLTGTDVNIPMGVNTAREILNCVVHQLPKGWQATALSAVLILYKETKYNYPGATVLARS
jgi:hypothetical protein